MLQKTNYLSIYHLRCSKNMSRKNNDLSIYLSLTLFQKHVSKNQWSIYLSLTLFQKHVAKNQWSIYPSLTLFQKHVLVVALDPAQHEDVHHGQHLVVVVAAELLLHVVGGLKAQRLQQRVQLPATPSLTAATKHTTWGRKQSVEVDAEEEQDR